MKNDFILFVNFRIYVYCCVEEYCRSSCATETESYSNGQILVTETNLLRHLTALKSQSLVE